MDDKQKKLDKVTAKINKKFQQSTKSPNNIVKTITSDDLTLEYVPSNAPEINEALGGGFPKKCIVTLHGAAGSGKTSLALSVAKSIQDAGGNVLFINTEGAVGVPVKMTGLDVTRLQYVEPSDYAEQIIDVIDAYAFDEEERSASGILDCIIVDSINALVPKQDIDKLDKDGAEGMTMATRARVLNDMLSRFKGRNYLKEGGILILVAQDRANINPNSRVATVISGGQALKYYSDVVIKLGKAPLYKAEKGKNVEFGHTVNFAVEKNKGTGFLKKGEYTVVYGIGIDDTDKLVADGQEWGYIVKNPDKRSDYFVILPDGDVLIEGGIAKVRERMKTDAVLRDAFRSMWKQGKPKEAPKLNEKLHPLFSVQEDADLIEEEE